MKLVASIFCDLCGKQATLKTCCLWFATVIMLQIGLLEQCMSKVS